MTTNNSIDAVGFPPLSVSLGGTNLTSTTGNQILYSSSNNIIGQITSANNGVLVTSGSGTPTIGSTLPAAVQANITGTGALSSGSITTGFSTIPVAQGGTGFSTMPANSIIYTPSSNTLAGLPANANGILISNNSSVPSFLLGPAVTNQILQSNNGAPPSWSTATYPSTTTINQILYSSAANTVTGLANVTQGTLTYDVNGVPLALALPSTQSLIGVQGLSPSAAIVPGNNRLINESFFVWQRGAGGSAVIAVPASTTAYTADRWQLVTNASQACTVTQTAGVLSGAYMAQVQRNSGQTGTGVIKFGQSLTRDMATAMAGSPATITFKALAGANFSSASSALTVSLITGTGTTDISGISGAAYTGSVTQSTTFTLTSGLTTFFVTFPLGSTVTQMCVAFSYTPVGTAGAADYFSLTDIQLEKSPNPTAIERKTWVRTYEECKPFYQKSFLYGTAPAQNLGTGTNELITTCNKGAAATSVSHTVKFDPDLFVSASPALAITFYSPAAATAQAYDETAASACSATTTRQLSAKSFVASYTTPTGGSGGATGNIIGVHWTVDCDMT